MFFVSHIFFIMPGGTASTGAVGDAQATTVERRARWEHGGFPKWAKISGSVFIIFASIYL